jgi:hypothetical protein
VPTEGWVSASFGQYPIEYGAIDTCLEIGGSLRLRDEGARDSQAESGPMWVEEAPAVSTIAGGVLHLTMMSPEGEAYIATPNNQYDPQDLLTNCNELCKSVTTATVPITHAGGWLLFAAALCTPPPGENVCSTSGINAEMNITSATVLFRNESTPTGTGFSGSLLNNPASGTANLIFEAHDEKGPGVYRVSIQVDGQVFWSATPSLNENKCVAHGTYAEALNFRNSQPCPQETGVRAEIPTAAITDGQHQLKAEVEDAAGNTAVVYDHTITIANHPATPAAPAPTAPALVSPAPSRGPANGDPASENAVLAAHWNDTSASRLTSSYRHRQKITGRLTSASGAAISAALVEVTQTPASLGAVASSLASTHTGPDGTFTVGLAANASSTIQLAYRSHLGDAQPAASAAVKLQVPASLHLAVKPHIASVGQTIVLSGTLAGAIPPGGKQLVLEGRALKEKWIQFEDVTTDAHGIFRAEHRFRLPGPMRYQFRVISKPEADFAYLKNTSNTVTVFER